ncbi:DUF4183 domain-containing protein [Lysinibacillus sp. NPDC093210]|uniref:DUF4183 domain-containing protein n=1 Tax=Lysinibacillus sp. NPDC093210 TaxID=3364133 RepID=UPI0037F1619B
MSMVKNKNFQKIEQLCNVEDRFIWPRIIARNAPITVPSPTIISNNTIIPKVHRYFYLATSDIQLTNGATLVANLFSDDNGVNVTEFSTVHPNGYVNLFINAVMQEGGIYSVTPTSLFIQADNSIIYRGTPIIIESIGFFNEVH